MLKRSSVFRVKKSHWALSLIILGISSIACKDLSKVKESEKSQVSTPLPEGSDLSLSAPTEEEFLGLQTLFASMQLGRVTATANAFSNGYHSGNSFDTEEDQQVDQDFFNDFWAGNYQNIDQHIASFTNLAAKGNHPVTMARLGFLNVWKFAERYRLIDTPGDLPEGIQAELGPNLGACVEYFKAAEGMAPQNAVYKGFAASCLYLTGLGPNGDANVLDALKTSQTAIKLNPEFNLFTIGYILTFFPHDSDQFKLGLEMFFRNLDLCFDGDIDRNNPDISSLIPLFVDEGNRKYCANSDKAPYNYQGFFLILGDLLVKNGQVEAAKAAYSNAKLLPSYATWPYASFLEDRLLAADGLVTPFRVPVDPMEKPNYPTTVFNTEFACMACHQKGE